MSMGYLTSGNEIVDAMGSINISGNIILAIWYKTITKENGKPYLLAIVILADIVYWYRPSEVRDQGTGHILGWKKKFSEDILRQSYQYYADLFGESKKTVKTAMDKLEQLQVIRREFRTVSYGDGLVCNNVMYVELKGDNALDMGDDEPEDENGEQSAQAQEGEPDRAEDIQAVAEEPIKPVASFLMSERIAEHDKERMLADGQRGRISIREKLTEMKEKAFEYNMPDKRECSKSKDKQETL